MEMDVIVLGCVLRVCIFEGTRTLVVWSVHNFGLDRSDWEALETVLGRDSAAARLAPMSYVAMLSGDFNFTARDEPGFLTFRRKVDGANVGGRISLNILWS